MHSSVSEVIRSLEGKEIEVTLEKVWSIPREAGGLRLNMQGGGTDGTYGYFILVTRGDSATAMSYIHKVTLDTWQTVKISKPLPLNHANDLAYDPKHHRLVISHCDIHPDRVSMVDPDTLELLETKTIPQKHFSIAYNANKGLYVTGKSRTYDLMLLDDDFQPVRLLPGEDGHVKQGLECDDEYIYFFQTGVRYNWIFVFDWEGTFLRKIPVPMVGESENLFVLGDGLIGAFNNNADNTADVYRMTLTEKDPPKKRELYYVNQLGYPHVRYEHNVENGGVIPERRKVATSGCGICCACMIVGNLTAVRPSVEEFTKLTMECGANCRLGSRMRILGPVIAKKYGLEYSTTNDPQVLLAHLNAGGMAVAYVSGHREGHRGLLSNISHYVVIEKAVGEELCVLDPAYQFGKFDTEDRRGKVRLELPRVFCSLADMEADAEPREIHYYLFRRK